MPRTHEHGTKVRLSFSGGPHAPVNMAYSMEEVNISGKNVRNGTFAALYFAIFRTASCRNLEVLQDFHRLFGSRNYRHSPYYPPCLQECVTRQRS